MKSRKDKKKQGENLQEFKLAADNSPMHCSVVLVQVEGVIIEMTSIIINIIISRQVGMVGPHSHKRLDLLHGPEGSQQCP